MAKLLKRHKKIWAARDVLANGEPGHYISLYKTQPFKKKYHNKGWYFLSNSSDDDDSLGEQCLKNFQEITGLKLKGGECAYIELHAVIIEKEEK